MGALQAIWLNTRGVPEGRKALYAIGVEQRGNDCLQAARYVFAVVADTGAGNSRAVRSTLSGAAVTNRLMEA